MSSSVLIAAARLAVVPSPTLTGTATSNPQRSQICLVHASISVSHVAVIITRYSSTMFSLRKSTCAHTLPLFSLDDVTSSWPACLCVIVSPAARAGVVLPRQARLHTACGALTYNTDTPHTQPIHTPAPVVCRRLFGLLS